MAKIGRPRWSNTYEAIHRRLQVKRGPVILHNCVNCGAAAHEWAYDHTDPNELKGTNVVGYRAVYSEDLERYQPMCRGCHRRMDSQRRRTEADA